jgi:hypothetical protein
VDRRRYDEGPHGRLRPDAAQRAIRFDVPRSRSLHVLDQARDSVTTAELMREFERWLNRQCAKSLGSRALTVLVVVATRDTMPAVCSQAASVDVPGTVETIGIETWTCVRNLVRDDTAYRLVAQAHESAATFKEQVAPSSKQAASCAWQATAPRRRHDVPACWAGICGQTSGVEMGSTGSR